MPVTSKKVEMVSPSIVAVTVEDSPWTKGALEEHDASAQTYEQWFSLNSSFAIPIGPDKDWVKYQDTHDGGYLDKDAADVAGNYGTIGGLTVTAVHRTTDPYDQGTLSPGQFTRAVSMRHTLHLPLSGDLAEGDHTVDFPAGTGLADFDFTFDDHNTRCLAIHVNQHGHRPGDSKIGYFSYWLPGMGANGELDLVTDEGLTTFDVIDEFGNQVFTGNIEARVGPTDAEAGYGFTDSWSGTANRQRYVAASDPVANIVSVTVGAATVIEYDGADQFSNGDVISLSGLSSSVLRGPGFEVLNNYSVVFFKVANVNTVANTFELHNENDVAIDTTGWLNNYVSGGVIYNSYLSNTVGTHVYGLDYSAFQPTNGGTYRIRIAGLGVSEPFRIDEAAYWKASQILAQGEYHLRSGVALDGFGYTRPVCFRSGQGGQTVLKSKLPYVFCTEFQSAGVAQNDGALSAYITTTEDTAHWGGWMDAGDWDTRHLEVSGHMLLWLQLYAAMSRTKQLSVDYGLPKSSATRGSLYDALDAEGDLLHSVIWWADTLRLAQEPSGAVPGGMNIGPGDIPTGEPSWLFRNTIFSYLPDHITAFSYAGVAAKLAKVLGDLGYTSLASTYQTSAEAAWNWAEGIYQNTAGARDAHYADFKAAALTQQGWSEGDYNSRMSEVQTRAVVFRDIAACCLFALTGSSTYDTIVTTSWPWDASGGAAAAAYEYSIAAGADAATAASMQSAITSRATTFLVGWTNSDVGYRSLGYDGITQSFGEKSAGWGERAGSLILAHLISGGSSYLNALQDGFSHIHGANQTDRSWTPGIGTKPVSGVLHRDAESSAQDVPNGLSVFGPTRFGGGTRALNLGEGSLNFIKWDGSTASPDIHHVMKPHPFSWPINQFLPQNSFMIEIMEFTNWQSNFAVFGGVVYLDLVGNNLKTEYETYTGAQDMLVEINGNNIRTSGSIIQAQQINYGIRRTWRGQTLDVPVVNRTVNVA